MKTKINITFTSTAMSKDRWFHQNLSHNENVGDVRQN